MAFPANLALVLGNLGPLVKAKIDETGQTPSEYVREAIAAHLGVEAPELREGNPKANRKTAKRANRARWGK